MGHPRPTTQHTAVAEPVGWIGDDTTVHFMIVVKSEFLKTMLNLLESIKRLNENLIAQKYFVISISIRIKDC